MLINIAAAAGAIDAAPHVRELNAVRPDSLQGLVEFALAIPTSHEAAIFYAALVAMLIGFFASWWVKYSIAKTVDDTLFDYFFRVHSRRTMGVVGTYLGTVIVSISTGGFDAGTAVASSGEVITGVFAGWQNVFGACVTAAMAADGTMNKGTQGAWTPIQREAEREKIAAKEAEAAK